MNRQLLNFILFFLTLLLLCGCSAFTPEAEPTPEPPEPDVVELVEGTLPTLQAKA